MSFLQREELWSRLHGHGLVDGGLPSAGEVNAPWHVRVMLGIAGWIGAIFLLCFAGAGLAFIFDNEEAAFAVGVLACVVAVMIFRSAPKNDFAAQFGLAVSLAGQVLMIFGVAECLKDSTMVGIALYVVCQQIALFIAAPNYLHRVWASWTAALATAYVLLDTGLYSFIPAVTTAAFVWLALSEFKLARHGTWVRSGMYGLALAAVQTSVLHGQLFMELVINHSHHEFPFGQTTFWLGRLASLAVLMLTVVGVLRRENQPLSSLYSRIAVIGALLFAAVSLKAPGVGPATAILIVGYANANRILSGLGIFALIGYLSQYYYSLQATLLEKSGLLTVCGLVLLLARIALKYWWPGIRVESKEAAHA